MYLPLVTIVGRCQKCRKDVGDPRVDLELVQTLRHHLAGHQPVLDLLVADEVVVATVYHEGRVEADLQALQGAPDLPAEPHLSIEAILRVVPIVQTNYLHQPLVLGRQFVGRFPALTVSVLECHDAGRFPALIVSVLECHDAPYQTRLRTLTTPQAFNLLTSTLVETLLLVLQIQLDQFRDRILSLPLANDQILLKSL